MFPVYDWVNQVIGDKASEFEVSYLLDSGVDLHNFQPSAADIVKIKDCDMFIYVGGESDAWVDDVFNNVVDKDIIKINLLEVLGDKVKVEETKEGMQHEHEEEHEEENEEEHEEEHEKEFDEHVWLSLKNAKYLCGIIKDNIVKLDSNNKATYEANLNNYNSLLDALDKKYEEVAKNASTKVLLFGDRFPFRYLVDDYGIDYYAAFSGCSAETEASFETIAFLTNKVDELGLKHVLKIEGPNDKIAKTIISNSKSKDQDVIEMDSMQSTSKGDVNKGATYLGVMENNLLSFEKALN